MFSILTAAVATAAAVTDTPADMAPPCAARAIAMSVDAREGDLNGMSHAGTYLIVRNTGRRACSLSGLPLVSFYDTRGRAVRATRQAPAGMHPGPVILPVMIPAGGRVATALRWVSGPVYDRNRSVQVQAVGMTVGGQALRTQLRATLVGQAGAALTFSQAPLTPMSQAEQS